jgi:pimeloyl-ACP methyl ester carboxylesterase
MTMPYADSDGVRLHYEAAGSGPSIIFAHELASDMRQWRTQMEHFSGRFRCVAYDARGYPPSDVPDDDASYGYDRFVADIGAVRRDCGLDDVFLVGWSMGAYASLLYALENPDHVKGVVAAGVGSGSPMPEIDGWRADMRALADAYETGGARAGAELIAAGANRQPLRRAHPEAWADFYKDLQSHSAAGMARVCRNYQGRRPSLMEFEARFRSMEAPVLLIVGDEDAACLATTRWLAEVIPGAGLLVMPGVGHCPNLEAPEAFNRAVEAFFG